MFTRTLIVGMFLVSFFRSSEAMYIPDPEEIYEAYIDGFIGYPEYTALLEIARRPNCTPADTAFLGLFPDLLIGLSSNPNLVSAEETIRPDTNIAMRPVRSWKQALLIRQSQKITPDSDRKRLYRLSGLFGRFEYYGVFDELYSGSRRWGRRYLEYYTSESNDSGYRVIVGSYSSQFGMGLTYGYRGQLFAQSGDKDDIEGLVYPRYGGSNGIQVLKGGAQGPVNMVYDRDRTLEFGHEYFGLSVPVSIVALPIRLSAGYGRLYNRLSDAKIKSSYGSIFGRWEAAQLSGEFELALSYGRGKTTEAAAFDIDIRRGRKLRVHLAGWSYATDYCAWFSGGPSSRRYTTTRLDEIDFKYSDRYRGESGAAIRSRYALNSKISFVSAAGYAWRNIDDNRAEARGGIVYRHSRPYSTKIDCYWRADNLYSDRRSQRRLQVELAGQTAAVRTRMVFGHFYDRRGKRDDFLLFLESRVRKRFGQLVILFKLDQLKPSSLRNNYMYAAISHETPIRNHMSSFIKYSRRYRKDSPGSSYDELRWDFNWFMQ